MSDIPKKPLAEVDRIFFSLDPGVNWDGDLSAVRIENGMVAGLVCGYTKPLDLQDGDVYYKLVDAFFVDEVESKGKHVISVDVVDEQGRRINGARVWHGWPTQRLPQYDERVQATVFGAQLAEWALYEKFDAWKDVGPYWVQPADGKADIFWGAGLPWGRHVSFALVFQRTTYQSPDPIEPPPSGTLAEALINAAQAAQVIQFNPDAALQQRIFTDGFVPNSPEFTIRWNDRPFVGQRAEHLKTGEARVYYCERGDWSNVQIVVIS